jgi:hypothetical protein
MSAKRSRLPVSLPNFLICIVCLATALVTGLLRDFLSMIIMLGATVGIIVLARVARRPQSSDKRRITSMEYRDERDRILAIDAFASVGAVALWLVFGEVVVAIVIRAALAGEQWTQWILWAVLAQSFILIYVWGRAIESATIEG